MSEVIKLSKKDSTPLSPEERAKWLDMGYRPYFTSSWQFVKCNRDSARAIASKCITKGYWFIHKQCEHNPKFHIFIFPASINFSADIVGKSKVEIVASVIPGEHMTQDKFTGAAAA